MSKTIAFCAVKGGVGKTTISLNTARRLHDKFGVKVGFLDADFDNSNFAQFTNIDEELKIVDSKEFQLYDWRGIQVFSLSLIAGRTRSVSMTGDRYAQMISDVLTSSNWNADCYIVDLPAGSSDVFRSVMQIFGETIAGNVVVTQPSMVDALNRILNLHKYFQIPVLGVVENMSTFECSECKTIHKPFGVGLTREVCKDLGAMVIGELPLSPNFSEKMVDGEALLEGTSLKTIDEICEIIIASSPVETGILTKIKDKLGDKIKSVVIEVIAKLINLVNDDFDLSTIRRETGFTERKNFRLMITDESMSKSLTHIDLRMEDEGLTSLTKADVIDFEVVTDFRTLSRIIMRERKIDGEEKTEHFDAWDAWLNGDLKAYGKGYSAKAVHAIREIFLNDELMDKVADKYGTLLRKFT